jgi:hypothetical protein
VGTYKVRNEIETKPNQTKPNQRKRNETKRNQRNENEMYDIWTSESLSVSKPGLNWVAGNVGEEYCNGQTCKMGYD